MRLSSQKCIIISDILSALGCLDPSSCVLLGVLSPGNCVWIHHDVDFEKRNRCSKQVVRQPDCSTDNIAIRSMQCQQLDVVHFIINVGLIVCKM